MMNQQLLDYIHQQTASGIGKESIRQSLIGAGWSPSDIDKAFVEIAGPAPSRVPNAQPPPTIERPAFTAPAFTTPTYPHPAFTAPPFTTPTYKLTLDPTPAQIVRPRWMGVIAVSLIGLLVLAGGVYAYIMNIGSFNRPPYTEANLVSGILKSISRIDTSSYSLSASFAVGKRDAGAVPFTTHITVDEKLLKHYQNDAKRAQDIGSLLSSLSTHKAPYPASLQAIIDDNNKSRCSYQTGVNRTRCLSASSSFYGNQIDPVTGQSYTYARTEGGKNFTLTVLFETDNAITTLKRSYKFSATTTPIDGLRVTFTKDSPSYFYLPQEPPKPTIVQLGEAMSFIPAEMSGSMSVSAQTDWRKTDADWKFTVDAHGDFSDLSYKFNADALKKDGIYYFKINNIPGLFLFGYLGTIKGQWIKVDPKTASSSQVTPIIGLSQLPEAEKSYKENRKQLTDLLQKTVTIAEEEHLLAFKSSPSSERIDGRSLYRYDLKINKKAITPFYRRLQQEMKTMNLSRDYAALIDKGYIAYLESPEFNELFDYNDKNTSLSLWVDAQGFPAIASYTLRVIPPDTAQQLKDKQVNIVFKLALSDINKPVDIKVPTPTKTIQELTNSNNSSRPFPFVRDSRQPDSNRVSDIKTMQLALELYYDACGQYPRQDSRSLVLTSGSAGGGEKFLKLSNGCPKGTSMASYLPTALSNPTPGGSDYTYCSTSDTSKTECSSAHNGTKSYILTFSLESPTAGLTSGKHIAVPNKIQ
ncbi:MAG: hypothetical protein Q8Q94_01400 [bacterium]|nr:hypothetical protein [bacterium]